MTRRIDNSNKFGHDFVLGKGKDEGDDLLVLMLLLLLLTVIVEEMDSGLLIFFVLSGLYDNFRSSEFPELCSWINFVEISRGHCYFGGELGFHAFSENGDGREEKRN